MVIENLDISTYIGKVENEEKYVVKLVIRFSDKENIERIKGPFNSLKEAEDFADSYPDTLARKVVSALGGVELAKRSVIHSKDEPCH